MTGPESMWKKCVRGNFSHKLPTERAATSEINEQENDKEGGHHLFSIPDQDVNNVPPF